MASISGKKNILVVGDYEGCRMVIATRLKNYDYDVDSASTTEVSCLKF